MTLTQSNPYKANMMYTPPSLPDYLSRNHTLNVIVGVSTDEEVKAIHDVIRAVNGMSAALYDYQLSTRLPQHLFTVQMDELVIQNDVVSLEPMLMLAVYRNEYPSNVFPSNTYTPPSIPSNIPISREPIIGTPSNEDLESAHGSVRTFENLVNTPFFDSTLSTKLSQHAFNIQLARYIQDSNQGHFTQGQANDLPSSRMDQDEPPVVTSGAPANEIDPYETQDAIPTGTNSRTPATPHAGPHRIIPEPNSTLQLSEKLDQLCAAQPETNRLLDENEGWLKGIKRTMVLTHLTFRRGQLCNNRYAYFAMNENGELPWMHHLDDVYAANHISLSRSISAQELIGHLEFYRIGAELIEEETGNLQPSKEADAQKPLARHPYYGGPPKSWNL